MKKRAHPLTEVQQHVAERQAQVDLLEEALREARHDLEFWERILRASSDEMAVENAASRQGVVRPKKHYRQRILAIMREEPRDWLVAEIIKELRERHELSTDANNVAQYLSRLRGDGLAERGGVPHAWRLTEKGNAP